MRRFQKASALWRYGGRPRPKCGRFAAGTRSPQSDGSHPAEARLERKIPAAAKGDPVPRAARSTDAFASLTSTPAAQRADTAGCTADRYSRAARQQAHVERMRHAALPCGNRRARRRRKPFCVQYVRLRAFLVTGWEDAATAARRTATAAFCAPQTPHGGVFPLRASPVPSAIIIPYFGENDKDSSKDFSQIAKFYPSFIFFS